MLTAVGQTHAKLGHNRSIPELGHNEPMFGFGQSH
jgi:hypothetical protein